MSVTSVQDWNEFLHRVGENFYDLVHGSDENSTEYTRIDYNNAVSYRGAYTCQGYNDVNYVVTCIGDFSLIYGQQMVFKSDTICNNCNENSVGVNNGYFNPSDCDFQITAPYSYIATNQSFWIGSDNIVYMKNASNVYTSNLFKTISSIYDSELDSRFYKETNGRKLVLNNGHTTLLFDYNGYDYYFSGNNHPSSFMYSGNLSAPVIIDQYPIIINTKWINQNSTYVNDVKNIYVNNGDTVTNYTYNIDNNNYITVNYSTDGNGQPTGYIDINPTGQISFDDLFDMFNTILAPIVGLDLPDWNDYLPPVVTGDVDVNVNIDLPDVTGEYPAETITPIESDVYNIMSIDSMPQLPSLTGIDNGESAAVLSSSFTFLDGCGLLMPFVTIAIIRLLISKFRGDS